MPKHENNCMKHFVIYYNCKQLILSISSSQQEICDLILKSVLVEPYQHNDWLRS